MTVKCSAPAGNRGTGVERDQEILSDFDYLHFTTPSLDSQTEHILQIAHTEEYKKFRQTADPEKRRIMLGVLRSIANGIHNYKEAFNE